MLWYILFNPGPVSTRIWLNLLEIKEPSIQDFPMKVHVILKGKVIFFLIKTISPKANICIRKLFAQAVNLGQQVDYRIDARMRSMWKSSQFKKYIKVILQQFELYIKASLYGSGQIMGLQEGRGLLFHCPWQM